jgi:hypothetical protein
MFDQVNQGLLIQSNSVATSMCRLLMSDCLCLSVVGLVVGSYADPSKTVVDGFDNNIVVLLYL